MISKLLSIIGRSKRHVNADSKSIFAQILMFMYLRLGNATSFLDKIPEIGSGSGFLIMSLYSKLSNFGHFEQMLLNVFATG